MNRKLRIGLPRAVEITLALLGLAVNAPVLAIAAILIKMNSQGPVLFRQKRVGQSGKPFTMFKFRTMGVASKGSLVTAANDARVTSVGRFLRKTKIDELPELWNVVKGDMSFVGPRPEVPEFVDLNDPLWKIVLEHRPGITDPVTLRLRNEEHLLAQVVDKERYYREVVQPYKLRGYARFVGDKSWKTDLRIIGRTMRAIVFPATAVLPTREEMQLSYGDIGPLK
jgi:lipopolysaccharide/colanic/teichoic acid biosynthesis glycosyltransferase